MSAGAAAILLGSGMLAGVVGTAGGITSLVSYPALLLVGLGPRAAGMANIVALTATWPSSAVSSRRELVGQGAWLRRHLVLAALGGALGTALLLATSPRLFAWIVPWLVAAGSLALLAAPRLTARRQRHAGPHGPLGSRRERWPGVAVLFVSVYNGYFGAGAGVMLLAACSVALDANLPTANAVKNMLVGIATATAAAGLVLYGAVAWGSVLPLGAGLLAGGALGPLVARRLPERVLRVIVAVLGLGLAVELGLNGPG